MKKSKNAGGSNIFVINVAMPIALSHYSTALCDFYYSKDGGFPESLSKKEANRILKNQLRLYGLQGEYFVGFFEAAAEVADRYNSIYINAKSWVSLNYPFLINPTTTK